MADEKTVGPAGEDRADERVEEERLTRLLRWHTHLIHLEETVSALKILILPDLIVLGRRSPNFIRYMARITLDQATSLGLLYQRNLPGTNILTGGPIRRSSIERYRRGELQVPPYDLRQPMDNAIWTILQFYVDFLERAHLRGLGDMEGESAANIYQDRVDVSRLRLPAAWQLEEHLNRLRALESDPGASPVERMWEGQFVIEALFAAGGGKPTVLPPDFLAWVESTPKPLLEDGPLSLDQPLAMIAQLIAFSGFGKLISQADAARRLGVTSTTIKMWSRIRATRLPELRIGRGVFVSESRVEELKAERMLDADVDHDTRPDGRVVDS